MLQENANVNGFCSFLLGCPTGWMTFNGKSNLIPTPNPKHVVCDKYSNILCFLKYVVAVVMAGVPGRRDELIKHGYVRLGRTTVLSHSLCSQRGQQDGAHHWYPSFTDPWISFMVSWISALTCTVCAWRFRDSCSP